MLNEDANEAEVAEPVLGQEPKAAEATAESSPASEEQHEQKSNGVQKRINDLTAKRYEAERKAAELEEKLAAIEAQKPKQIADAPEPPAAPSDIYDDAAMKQYHADMVKYSQDMAQAASKNTFQEYQQSVATQTQQAEAQKVVGEYAKNAVRDGVDIEKLRVAESELNRAGISPALGDFIMKDPNGGKVVEYLYDNPALMHEVLSMDPVSAGIKIASEVKPQALSTTPKVSGAPEPTPEITGGGVVEKDDFDRLFPGTTFN